jgi:hypothetical protein
MFKQKLTRARTQTRMQGHDIRSEWISFWPKNWSQEDTSNKLEKEPLREYKTAFCSPLAHTVLHKKICKDLAMFLGFFKYIWP